MISSRPENHSAAIIPDLTPLLDIIFIVMVFLLLTANVQIKTLAINVPQTNDSNQLSTPDKNVIVVNILPNAPFWALEGKPISDWQLVAKTLLETITNYPEKSVVIAADKQANIENLLTVLRFMQKHQISATQILMEEQP